MCRVAQLRDVIFRHITRRRVIAYRLAPLFGCVILREHAKVRKERSGKPETFHDNTKSAKERGMRRSDCCTSKLQKHLSSSSPSFASAQALNNATGDWDGAQTTIVPQTALPSPSETQKKRKKRRNYIDPDPRAKAKRTTRHQNTDFNRFSRRWYDKPPWATATTAPTMTEHREAPA